MWHKHNQFLRENADDYSYDSGGSDENVENFSFEDSNTDNQEGAQPSHQNFDYEALARANAQVLTPVLERFAPQQKSNEFDQAEFDKLTKKFTPDENLAKAILGEHATPQQAQALQQLTNGIYQHLYASTGLALRSELDPIRGELTPLKQAQLDRQQRDFENDVANAIPALKPHGKLVSHAIAVLKQQGYAPQGATPQEQRKHAFTQVARFVEAQIRVGNPTFSLKSAGGNNAGRGGMPQMATMTSGGARSGSNQSSGKKQPAWQSVLGK
jgi:hypothetical protein